MRGRKPLPQGVKDFKAGRVGSAHAAGPVPLCPEWLDEDATVEWDRLLPKLEKAGLLSEFDMAAFASYCQCWSHIKEATILLRETGMIVKGSTGQDRVNPLAQHLKELYVQLRAYATEFGFTPSSRSRVDTSSAGTEEEDMEGMLNEHNAIYPIHGQAAHG